MVETLRRQWWSVAIPIVGVVVLMVTWNIKDLPLWAVLIVGAVLAAAVLVAVHHAEVIAHRAGEPYGSLVLAVAVTVIEVGLILTLVLAGGEGTASLARDTVFAAVMITTNGVVGLSLFAGSIKHGIVRFNREGAGALLAAVVTLAVLCFVLPVVTTGGGENQFTRPQLIFAAVISLAVYVLVVTTQTLRHRDFFLPVPTGRRLRHPQDRRRRRRGRGARRTADQQLRRAEPRDAARVAGGRRRTRQDRVTVDRGRTRERGHPADLPRCRDCAARAAAGVDRSGARGIPQSAADQPQPRLRVGAREHRTHDPDHRDRVALPRRSRCCSASGARRSCSCCSPRS